MAARRRTGRPQGHQRSVSTILIDLCNPRLAKIPEEEAARQLVLEGRLEAEPSPPLVADALHTIETEEDTLTCS